MRSRPRPCRRCSRRRRISSYIRIGNLDGDYRRKPDAEVMAPTTARWFYEIGTEGGLVDFPALYGAMKEVGWKGWVGVEHDKADVGGGNYPESTAIAAWTIRNVLRPIHD